MRVERQTKNTSYAEFSDRYNCNISTIHAAISGMKWKSVEMPCMKKLD